jgi:hypothetical protein
MNREIKVRYTYKNQNRKSYISKIFTLDEIQVGCLSNWFNTLKGQWTNIGRDFFTGIIDKNKHEVYSGHILLIPDYFHERILDDGSGPNEPFNHLAPVVFESGCFGVIIIESAYNLNKRFYTFIELESEGVESIEIVGNIYQNSDLIKP